MILLEQLISQIQSMDIIVLSVVITALMFDFVNGWNDSANAIATIVSTRVLTPLKALLMAAALNMAGALAGTAVAKTITSGIVRTGEGFLPNEVVPLVLLSAMIAAIIWAAWMTFIGMPISGSHSLLGGLCGAAVAAGGISVLIGSGVSKILIALLVSPILGGLCGYLLILILTWIVRNWRPTVVNNVFSPLQIGSCSLMAFNHGLNDAQKVMGIITLALVSAGIQQPDVNNEIHPELWVKIACGVMISLGTAIGGWKVIKTLGVSLSSLNPFGGFVAETSASIVLAGAASMGIPVSTTHTITGSIMGTAASRGLHSVRWAVGKKIVMAWVFTLPATSMIASICYWLLAYYLGYL